MPFTKHPDPVNGGEIEIFEGYVDFVSIKEKKQPDQYGKTHTVSVCVDGEGGKGGTWMFFPAIKEDRIRHEGMACSVQADDQWYELCKGFKIRVVVKRNGDFINAQIKSLKVLEVAEPVSRNTQKSEKIKEKAITKKSGYDDFPIGGKVNHARSNGAMLAKQIGCTVTEAAKQVHIATSELKKKLSEEGFGNVREVGNAAGNAVISAIPYTTTLDSLLPNAIKMQTLWDELYGFIESYESPKKEEVKEEPKVQETTKEGVLDEPIIFDDDVPF